MPNWEQALQPIRTKNSYREEKTKESVLFGDIIPFVWIFIENSPYLAMTG